MFILIIFQMKKIIVSIILMVFSVTMLFATAENIDQNINSSVHNSDNSDIVQKIELSDYYGMTSLLVNLHLELGRGVADEKWIFYVVDLLNQMKYYSDLNIIDYLWYSFDIRNSLDALIFEMSDILDKSMTAKIELWNNLISLIQEKEDCDLSKKLSDKNFALALKDFDSKNMEINLNKSLEYEECAWEARIYYNVQDKILNKLEFYFEILDNKYTYYRRNRAEIIQYYPEISYELITK